MNELQGEKVGKGMRWEEEIIRRKMRWAGHVIRRGEERRAARIMREKPSGEGRQAGRPKTKWEDSMRWVSGDDWREKAMDREAWRF